MNEEPDAAPGIAREIESYLASRPGGADSVEGILRWWLPHVRLEEVATELQRALDLLVARGALIRFELPGGQVVYGRAPVPSDARTSLEEP